MARGVDHGPLTAREWEVATWIAKGLDNGEIAKRLDLSRATVASQVTKILKKLRYGSRVQVAVWVTDVRLQAALRPRADATRGRLARVRLVSSRSRI